MFSSRLFALMVHSMLPLSFRDGSGTIDRFVRDHGEAVKGANARARTAGRVEPFDTFVALNDRYIDHVRNRAYKRRAWYHPDDQFKVYYVTIEFDRNDPEQFYVSVFTRLKRIANTSYTETLMESHIHVITRAPNAISYVITDVYPVKIASKSAVGACKVHSREFAVAFVQGADGSVFLQRATPMTVPKAFNKETCVTSQSEDLTPEEAGQKECVGMTGKLLRMMFEVFLVDACNHLTTLRHLTLDTSAEAKKLKQQHNTMEAARQYAELVKAVDGLTPFTHERRVEALTFWNRHRHLLKEIRRHQLNQSDVRHTLWKLKPKLDTRTSNGKESVIESIARAHCRRVEAGWNVLQPVLEAEYAPLVERSRADNVMLNEVTRWFEDGAFGAPAYDGNVERTEVAVFVMLMEDGYYVQVLGPDADAKEQHQILKETYLWLMEDEANAYPVIQEPNVTPPMSYYSN